MSIKEHGRRMVRLACGQSHLVTSAAGDDLNWEGIVKVQRSLNDKGAMVLIYSEDRSIWFSGPTGKTARWFKQGEEKFFARAELRGTIINLRCKAGWQEW